jgi:hypothetical protein
MRDRVRGHVTIGNLDIAAAGGELGDGLGRELAADRIAAENAGIDVEQLRGEILWCPGAMRSAPSGTESNARWGLPKLAKFRSNYSMKSVC